MPVEWRMPRKRSRTQITFSILSCLRRNPGLRRTELAMRVSLNGAQLGRAVFRLVGNDIIEDRSSRLYLTEKGTKALSLLLGYYELMGVDVETIWRSLYFDNPTTWPDEQPEESPTRPARYHDVRHYPAPLQT